MGDGRTLILKSDGDAFERFFSNHMRGCAVDVSAPFKGGHTPLSGFGIKLLRHLPSNPFTLFGLQEWAQHVNDYATVIVFDNGMTPSLVQWLNANYQGKVIIWYWNIPSVEPLSPKHGTTAIFDKEYASAHGLAYVHQFFFTDVVPFSEPKYDLAYVGYDKNRYATLRMLANQAMDSGLATKFMLYSHNHAEVKETVTGIEYMQSPIPYEDVLAIECNSRCIVELNLRGQYGITLRALESLCMHRKLITNNESIEDFSFYNPRNIFILGRDRVEDLRNFVQSPYAPINRQILNDYSYEDWLHRIVSL